MSEKAVATVNAGKLPFNEPGAAPVLDRVVKEGSLLASSGLAVRIKSAVAFHVNIPLYISSLLLMPETGEMESA